MPDRSKLVRMRISNIGCIGPEGLTVELDDVLCIVGPNNTGKSTVLRAYELAVGTERFDKNRDLCKRADDGPATIELWVHIPEGTANIAEKWKENENELRLVRSRWEWSDENNWTMNRQTWDPEIEEYATDDRASGLNPVFSSRLPTPFRIGTLEDPEEEHKKLLTLILQPVAERLRAILADTESELNKTLNTFIDLAQIPVEEEKTKLDKLKDELNRSHNEIFPDLQIDFDIGLGSLEIDPIKHLQNNSQLKFREWDSEIDWKHQGTGSQRALFWTMLQVRSGLKALSEVATKQKKEMLDMNKQIKKLEKDIWTVKKDETKQKKYAQIQELEAKIKQFKDVDPERLLKDETEEFSLPGYMLLIDEPEVALHPGAVRAASKYLYNLAEDPAWQVMITTHSPLFIDPLQDHTTIVRLDRTQTNPTPKTFRSDDVGFSDDDKTALKMLNRFDQGLSEMFFGQHPLLVEGDTEFAVFEGIMNDLTEVFPPHSRPTIVRARGKWTLVLLVRMLTHFRVAFSILHDTDNPTRRDGKQNAAWSANTAIYTAICDARKAGVRLVHRVSVPDFERAHLLVEVDGKGNVVDVSNKEKPWRMLNAVQAETTAVQSISTLLQDLLSPGAAEEPFESGFEEGVKETVTQWAQKYAPKDSRYSFDKAPELGDHAN